MAASGVIKLAYNITVKPQIRNGIEILSVHGDHMLDGEYFGLDGNVYIYNTNGLKKLCTSHVHTLSNHIYNNSFENYFVEKAELISSNKIAWVIYSDLGYNQVIITTLNGSVVEICTQGFTDSTYISFNVLENLILTAGYYNGIQASYDEGLTWKQIIKNPVNDETKTKAVVKKPKIDADASEDIYCTLKETYNDTLDFYDTQLATYRSKQRGNNVVLDSKMFQSKKLFTNMKKHTSGANLVEDGRGNLFVYSAKNQIVHLYALKDITYLGSMFENNYFTEPFHAMAVDGREGLMYVAFSDKVSVFELAYDKF